MTTLGSKEGTRDVSEQDGPISCLLVGVFRPPISYIPSSTFPISLSASTEKGKTRTPVPAAAQQNRFLLFSYLWITLRQKVNYMLSHRQSLGDSHSGYI